MDDRRAIRLLELPLGACAAAVLAASFLFSRIGIPDVPPAPLVRLGIPAPTTGLTRGFVAITEGRLNEAIAWHPLAPVLFLAVAATVVVAAVSLVRGRRSESVARVASSRTTWIAVTVAFAAVWVRQILVLG